MKDDAIITLFLSILMYTAHSNCGKKNSFLYIALIIFEYTTPLLKILK